MQAIQATNYDTSFSFLICNLAQCGSNISYENTNGKIQFELHQQPLNFHSKSNETMGLSSESIPRSNYFLSIYENSFFFKNTGMSEESMEEIMRNFKELHPDFELRSNS